MLDPLLQLPITSTLAQYSQGPTYYAARGTGDLLVLIHGSLCDLRYWRWQINKLYDHCEVVSLSLPGYWPNNPSSAAYEFDLMNQVAAVADVIDQKRQSGQKIYVLGHSRGALVATQYALQHAPIDGLILADPAFTVNEAPPALPVLGEAASLLANGQDEQGLALFIDAVSGKNTWRQMVGWFKTMVEDNAHTLIAQSREELPVLGADRLSAFNQLPLLLINGALSPKRYQNSAEQLLKHLSHAQHALIPNASHGMNLANPKAFNKALLNFMHS